MDSVPTRYLALTTTFTPPADCWETPLVAGDGTNTQWFIAPGGSTTTCFPLAFPFSETSLVYSPGICPTGWTSACQESATIGSSTIDVVKCCPESMGCVSSTSYHSWEASFGCVSRMEVGPPWLAVMNTQAPFLSSMYQRPVMVVSAEATTTLPTTATGSQTSTMTTSDNASQTGSSTNTPASQNTNIPIPKSNELTKGAIAGIAIGTIVGTAIIALLAYGVWIIKRKQAAQPSTSIPYSEYPQAYPSYEANVSPMEVHGEATQELPGGKFKQSTAHEME